MPVPSGPAGMTNRTGAGGIEPYDQNQYEGDGDKDSSHDDSFTIFITHNPSLEKGGDFCEIPAPGREQNGHAGSSLAQAFPPVPIGLVSCGRAHARRITTGRMGPGSEPAKL